MISVCMATYNGSRWIEEQLLSILLQLQSDDEVVIVDDASNDDTTAKIMALHDPRIRLLRNECNRGVDATFERAIAESRGDILFLCDQDDLWHPNKVSHMLTQFERDPAATLVISDATIIDADGAIIGGSYFHDRGRFIPGVIPSIVKSKFLGCLMAFRASLKEVILPFPHPIPGHDMWIGSINEVYGRSLFTSETLVAYRRHGSNLSPSKHQSFKKMIVWRWQLVRGLICRISRGRRKGV